MLQVSEGQKLKKWIVMTAATVFLAGIGVFAARDGKEDIPVFAEAKQISINEVCCKNFSVNTGTENAYCDYIELYNCGEEEISLENYGLSDRGGSHFFFTDQKIPPGGYLVLEALGLEGKENQVNFKLSSKGEELFLTDSKGKTIDYVSVPALKYNTCYCRETDGTGQWKRKTPTPGQSNEGAKEVYEEVLREPEFSAESGFYEKAFLLTLKAGKKDSIYYTLDGSEPTEDSFLYEDGILIEDASQKENVYSARTDLSAAFFAEENRFAVPEKKVDKGVVVRAAVIDREGKKKSKTVSKTYFVGFGEKDYEKMAFLSLVTEPDNLFGYEKGIYVAGKRYDDFLNNGEREKQNNPENWRWWKGNYYNRGREWEKPVHIDFWGADRSLILSQECGIRIKGGTSRSFTQKSFNLFARDIYNETGLFDTAFFGERGKKRVAVFSGAQDYRLKVRDALLHDALKDRAFSTMNRVPCYVFLDGEYWGLYWIMDKYGAEYLHEVYGIGEEEAVIVKNHSLDTGEEEDIRLAEELNRFISENDFRTEENYEKLCAMIDMESYTDYFAAQIYINRCQDWPGDNEAYWRTRTAGKKPYQDGKWRWMLFDVNWECLADEEENSIAYVKEKSELFRKLCDNEQFKKDFTITVCDLANTVFAKEKIEPEFLGLLVLTKDSVLKDLEKYYGDNKTEKDYWEEVEEVESFIQNRKPFMMKFLKEEFGLKGRPESLSIKINEEAGGTIKVNTTEAEFSENEWSGSYFTDYPVRLTAREKKGYRFKGWSGAITSPENSVEILIPEGGLSVTAEFEKITG